MKSGILWKSIFSVLLVVWSILNIVPYKDTPFPVYIRESVTAEKAEFTALLDRLDKLVQDQPRDYPTLFVAMNKVANEERLDLARYFPDLNVQDQKNISRRNDLLMRELLKRSQSKIKLGLDLKGGVSVVFRINEEDLSDENWERVEQISQAKGIIAQRVDGLGVAESVIRVKGETHIEVQMPGISTKDNPDILRSIGAPALLEFSLVNRTADPMTNPEPPLGYVKMSQEIEDPKTGELLQRPEYIRKIPLMTGDIISRAMAVPNEFGGYKIILRFTDSGEEKFAQVTRQIADENQRTNTLGRLAIVLDGKLYSAPSVREEIRGGAEITGRFSQREAIELANVLNNPLQVGLKVESMSEIGPSLAKDARASSLLASLAAATFVLLFMGALYQLGGVIAVAALILNILIVLASLASFGATLSLPGVAGMVLTIGMAVDANILIFERMREELRAGKTLHAALHAGHEKALSAILDSNFTTIATALILIWLGVGPVKGFGITLAIGIIANIFCVLIVARLLLDLVVEHDLVKKLFATKTLLIPELPFLEHRRKAFAIAIVCFAVGLGSLLFSHHRLFGIDFVGGDEISVGFQERLTSAQIDSVASREGIGEVSTVFRKPIGGGEETFIVQTPTGRGENLYNALANTFPEAGLNLVGKSVIGATVGLEVQLNAIYAVLASLVVMLLYIAIRFEFGYAFGAIGSLLFTVLVSIGLFIFWGTIVGVGSGQFTAPMVAAILMVLGYAINDTIVVFDRIREELVLNPGMQLRKVINMSISRTFSRTILTGTATLVSTLLLILFGSGVIVDFALMFFLGVITGTFSSIFIASPIFFWYHKGDRRKVEEHHVLPVYEWSSGADKGAPAKSK